MDRQQMQLPSYQHITGAVQIPLLMLVWGALVLFFGHQYQANALLPTADRKASVASLETDDLLRAQQRNDELLEQLALQQPIQVPSLLDRQTFAADLAAELTGSDLSSGVWQPGLPEVAVEAEAIAVVDVTPPSDSIAKPIAKSIAKDSANPSPLPAPVPVVIPVQQSVISHQAAVAKTVPVKAPKFVRLPAKVQAKLAMRVDALRISKDHARSELMAGRSGAAYVRLRGQIAKGRTDIEFLGLLALASLQQQPAEAQVLYEHLVQLQPDTKRWQQGLAQSQLLLASAAAQPMKRPPNGLSQDGAASVAAAGLS